MLGISVMIRLIMVSRFFLTSPRQEYMDPVVSKEKTISSGAPATVAGAAPDLLSLWAGVDRLRPPIFTGDAVPEMDTK